MPDEDVKWKPEEFTAEYASDRAGQALWLVLSDVYQIIYGEFSIDRYDTVIEFGLFIFSSIFLSVILLNIVIAIMSDTYERVMTNIVENDARQQNAIVLKKEASMFWKRSQWFRRWRSHEHCEHKAKHLYWLQYQRDQKKPWKSQVDHIITTVTDSQQSLM